VIDTKQKKIEEEEEGSTNTQPLKMQRVTQLLVATTVLKEKCLRYLFCASDHRASTL